MGVSIGNVLHPSKPAGFIADLDLSSIDNGTFKAVYPDSHQAIIGILKDGKWRTVRLVAPCSHPL